MLVKNFRVLNNDLYYGVNNPVDIIGEFSTYEEAVDCTIESYYFMCTIQERVRGEWLDVIDTELVSQLGGVVCLGML